MPNSAVRLLVEPAPFSDADLIAPLFDAYRQFYGAAPDLPAARDFLAARLASGESVVLVAILESGDGSGDTVAGFAQLYPSFSSLALGRSVVLNDLFVAPECRRLGVGRRLVRECIEYARRSGASCIELATQVANESALALYESEGFTRDTEFVHLRREPHARGQAFAMASYDARFTALPLALPLALALMPPVTPPLSSLLAPRPTPPITRPASSRDRSGHRPPA